MRKFFYALVVAFFLILTTKVHAYILYVPTPTPTPAPIRLIIIPTATPVPTAAPTLAPIRYYSVPTPTPTPTTSLNYKFVLVSPAPVINKLYLQNTSSGLTVNYPPSTSIMLNGQLEEYMFTVSSQYQSASYHYRIELWHNGQLLGNISPAPLFSPFGIDPTSASQVFGEVAGRYWPTGATKSAVASIGAGYSIRVVLMQNGKDIVSATSSPFSYVQGNYTVNPKITITSPNGGESYPLDGSIKYVMISYSGLDPYKNGNYKYQVFLLKGGQQLGPIGAVEPFELNGNVTSDILGYQSGKYYNNGIKVASAGNDYTMKIVVTLNDQVVASDTSDSNFSFTDTAQNPNPPLVHVLSPNGGEVIPITNDKTYNILFEQKNLDPYYGGSYKYIVQLLRNGTILGYLVSSTPFELNEKETSDALGFRPNTYIDQATHATKNIESGGGYKVKVTIFKVNTPILSDESDGTFSFGGGTSIYVNQFFATIKDTVTNILQLL